MILSRKCAGELEKSAELSGMPSVNLKGTDGGEER
jgi:hypothetical protein